MISSKSIVILASRFLVTGVVALSLLAPLFAFFFIAGTDDVTSRR